MTEQELVQQLKENDYKGLRSENIRKDKWFIINQKTDPYPLLSILRCSKGKIYEKTITSEQHTNFRKALENYNLQTTFDNAISYYHSWGIEFYLADLLKSILEELTNRCEDNQDYKDAWSVARDMIFFIDLNEKDHFVVCFEGYSACLCKLCFTLKTLIYLPRILYSHWNIKRKTRNSSWPTTEKTSVN